MYIKRNIEFKSIVRFGWRAACGMAALSTTAWVMYEHFGTLLPSIPYAPVATIGTAVAVCVGFKNNSSYDRLWEARKIWGEITNLSRSLSAYLISVSDEESMHKASSIIRRQILFVNVLRAQLRKNAVWENTQYLEWSKALRTDFNSEAELTQALAVTADAKERKMLSALSNPAREIMQLQITAITRLKREGIVDAFEASDLIKLCTSLIDQQGKAERIKNFPFPRQYACLSEMFVYLFILLLPFGLLHEFASMNAGFSWLVIPLSVVIGWIFTSMEQAGDTSEDPFAYGINDVPMTAICRQIEIDLLEMLGEQTLPQPVTAREYVLL